MFKSETDSEVIPHLIEENLKAEKNFFRAFKKSLKKLKGSFAIVAVSVHEPDKIYCARKDSPLVLGIAKNKVFCASDVPAFLKHTNRVVVLHNDEVAVLERRRYRIENLISGEKVSRKPFTVTWSVEMAQKGGFPHFMLKEIHEQPYALRETLKFSLKELEAFVNPLIEKENIYLISAGTSFYASLAGQYMLNRVLKKPVLAIVASEFPLMNPHISEDSVALLISQSGETMDTLRAADYVKERNGTVLSIVNVVGSSLTRKSDHVFYTRAGPEIGVAATKSFTTQLLSLACITTEIARRTGEEKFPCSEIWRKTKLLPSKVDEVIRKTEMQTKKIAEWISNKENCFFLGRGINTATALEGALKMKEISYIHSEGYPAGESKHGPIALIEENYPVIFVSPNDETREKIIGNISEMKARGAHVISLIEEGDKEIKSICDESIEIPEGYSNILSPILYVIPLQLLAYYTAIQRKCDPDKPRNLAKSVTVD